MTTRQCVKVSELRKKGYNKLWIWLEEENNIYIGRNMSFYVKGADASYWRNPYTVKKYGLKKCLELYKNKVLSSKNMMNRIEELRGKCLGCFCFEELCCHADVLIDILNSK